MAHLTRIKANLKIPAHRKVSGLLDGRYASLHHARSLDFADLREYVVGDDVKDIDWKATARHARPLVKTYVADRKHTVLLAVATGRTFSAQASVHDTKSDVALMFAGLLGYLATRHGDSVGLCACAPDRIEAFRPSMREIEVERMLNRAEGFCTADAVDPDRSALLDFVLASTHRRNIVVIICDDVAITPTQVGLLTRAVAQHQVFLVTIADLDPTESSLRDVELVEVATGRAVPDFVQGDQLLAAEVAASDADRHARRAELCKKLGIAHVQVASCDEVIPGAFALLAGANRVAR